MSIGSGRTLKACVAQIGQIDPAQHRLVSLVGAIAQDGSSNRYDVAQQLSEKTGGKHFMLPAPLMADSETERAQWVNHRLYCIVDELAQRADVTFVGIGNVGVNCPLHEDGFITLAEVDEMMGMGAVAKWLGLPIDADGHRVQSKTGPRVTSLKLDTPPKRPTIGFAGGQRKREALIAALRENGCRDSSPTNCARRPRSKRETSEVDLGVHSHTDLQRGALAFHDHRVLAKGQRAVELLARAIGAHRVERLVRP